MTQVSTPQISKDAGRHFEAGVGRILGGEVKPAFLDPQALDGQFSVHGGDDDLSGPRFDSSVDD